MNKKGFTLAEVLAVIVLMGILVTIAIPTINTITNNINKRLFNTKKELILTSAEKYAKDNKEFFTDGSMTVTIDDLVKAGYVEIDAKNNENGCTNINGCVINPSTKETINDIKILIQKQKNGYTSIWNQEAVTTNGKLIDKIKSDLKCTSLPCVYKGNIENNYLYDNGIMWRIMGVYDIGGTETVKLITDDTISWEEE